MYSIPQQRPGSNVHRVSVKTHNTWKELSGYQGYFFALWAETVVPAQLPPSALATNLLSVPF